MANKELSHEEAVAMVAKMFNLSHEEAEQMMLEALARGELRCLAVLDDGAKVEVTGQQAIDLGVVCVADQPPKGSTTTEH